MQAEMPFYENPESALRACVEALGGAKKVGAALFPDKKIEDARNYLLACVNENRTEKLGYGQILWIFREAKRIGFHAGYDYWSGEAEYESKPVSQAEEIDRLTITIEQSSKTLAAALATLERIKGAA